MAEFGRLPGNVKRLKGEMEAATDAAIGQMEWLKPSDQAMVELALQYARQIDQAVDDARAVGYLGQQLHGVLRSLGGTPLERKALAAEEGGGGALAELRKTRAARQRSAKDIHASAAGVDA